MARAGKHLQKRGGGRSQAQGIRVERSGYFRCKLFSRIQRIHFLPRATDQNPCARNEKGGRRAGQRQQTSGWKRFLGGRNGGVQDFYAGHFFGFLHFGQFVLLGEQFVNGFLNFGLAEKVGVGNAEQRQLADGGIQGRIGFRGWRCRSSAHASHFSELRPEFRDSSTDRADANVL